MAEIVVRKALVGEAAVLRSICLQSKRSWGYSDEFMTRFSEQTIIDADSISTDYVVVASQGETIIGWLRILTNSVYGRGSNNYNATLSIPGSSAAQFYILQSQ